MPKATITFLAQASVTTSEIQISASAPTDCVRVKIKALTTNGGVVYIGKTGVLTTTGYPLGAGQETEIVGDYAGNIDATQLYAIGSAGTQAVAISCVRAART